jgi:hypothetical protein
VNESVVGRWLLVVGKAIGCGIAAPGRAAIRATAFKSRLILKSNVIFFKLIFAIGGHRIVCRALDDPNHDLTLKVRAQAF